MLRQLDMGGGNATNHALFAEGTDLRGLMQIYGQIGSRLIVQTAEQRWTEVKIDERRYAGSLRGNRERYVPH